MNTIVRSYKVDYDAQSGEYVESVTGSMPVTEYSNGSVTQRVITLENFNNLKKKEFWSIIEHQVMLDSVWITTGKGTKAVANNNYFVRLSDGELVPRSEAMELVNNLEAEVLDESDPENPVSFDPKVYLKKEALKAGYMTESDVILSQFSPTLFPFYEGIMVKKFELETP